MTFESLLDSDCGMHWCLTRAGQRLTGEWKPGPAGDCLLCVDSWEQTRREKDREVKR